MRYGHCLSKSGAVGYRIADSARDPSKQTIAKAGSHVEFNRIIRPVGYGCDTDGHWACATHQLHFPQHLALDGHLMDDREHLIAFVCIVHGLEERSL